MTANHMKAGRAKFRRERTLYDIKFEDDPELAGFWIRMRSVTLEEFVEVTELAAALETPEGRTKENIEKQFQVVGSHLAEWNYADEDGTEYPATYDGLKKLDFRDVMKILYGWMQALTSVPKSSSSDSSSGGTSEESSLGLGSVSLARES